MPPTYRSTQSKVSMRVPTTTLFRPGRDVTSIGTREYETPATTIDHQQVQDNCRLNDSQPSLPIVCTDWRIPGNLSASALSFILNRPDLAVHQSVETEQRVPKRARDQDLLPTLVSKRVRVHEEESDDSRRTPPGSSVPSSLEVTSSVESVYIDQGRFRGIQKHAIHSIERVLRGVTTRLLHMHSINETAIRRYLTKALDCLRRDVEQQFAELGLEKATDGFLKSLFEEIFSEFDEIGWMSLSNQSVDMLHVTRNREQAVYILKNGIVAELQDMGFEVDDMLADTN